MVVAELVLCKEGVRNGCRRLERLGFRDRGAGWAQLSHGNWGPLEIMEEDSHGSQVQGGFGASSNVRTISARKTDYTTPKGKGNYCEIREKDKGYITRYLRCPPPSHLY